MANKFVEILLHTFMPNCCMLCNKPIEYNKDMCDKCREQASYARQDVCLICRHSVCRCKNHFKRLVTPFFYDMGIELAIQNIKFHGDFHTAKKLASYMVNTLKDSVCLDNIDYIVPVPLYKRDFTKRGFNQSQKLGEYISKDINKPMCDDLLVKIRETKKQHDLNQKQRYENLKDAFSVTLNYELTGKTIVLIDDVYTTGSTMNTCSRELVKAGAKEVIALTGAKTAYTDEKIN